MDELANIVISMYLFYASVLVSELAFGSFPAHFDLIESLAVFSHSSSLLVFNFLGSLCGCKFFVIMGKYANFTVAASSVLDEVLA